MLNFRKVDSSSYYNTLPNPEHECGDIWRDLPCFGLLGSPHCNGIVITPACDLSWQKSDTITYLPIVAVRSYFSMDAVIPSIVEKLLSIFDSISFNHGTNWAGSSYIIPSEEEIKAIIEKLNQFKTAQQRGNKVNTSIDRAHAGLTILNFIKSVNLETINASILTAFYGSEWAKIKERIIKNSYSSAIHFLPSDRQEPIFSAVPTHSVVLFRYPITVPVRILNQAQEIADHAWHEHINTTNLAQPLRSAVEGKRPIKLASLKSAFLSDLLTRFSALYNRVGSPDFTNQTINSYLQEVDG
jgi:hypothetical protein